MDLLSSTLGAVGQVDEGIDKFTGGRALRGALAGKPRELLSVLPFSDTAGITNERDKTSGRDLTDQYGLTHSGDKSLSSHALGFAADTVLSPGNLLAGYGAFKAAPTLAKGITQGAKALTGLDFLDHVGTGARKLAGFASGDAGSLKFPRDMPLPIDTSNLKDISTAANASRPRRFSTDPARKDWYAADRQARFGKHFGNGPGNTAVPGGIPEFHLNDAIRRFGADESGSLKIGSMSDRLGGNLDMARAAMVNGPQYPGGVGKLEDILRGIPNKYDQSHLDALIGNPEAAKFVSSEIPEGSSFLGAGSEGMAFRSPFGHAIRFQNRAGVGRVKTPEMLQPYRSVSRAGYTVEHTPLVNGHSAMNAPVSGEIQAHLRGLPIDLQDAIYGKMDALHSRRSQADYGLSEARLRTLGNLEKHKQWSATDYGTHNVGFTDEGNILAFDPGAIIPGRGIHEDKWADAWSRPIQMPKGQEGMLAAGSDPAIQIDRVGGPAMIRDALMEAISGGSKGQGVAAPELGKDIGGLMRAVRGLSAKGGDPAEAIRQFMGDESGYLRHAIPGVDPELANAMDGLGPQYPGGTQKLRDIAAGIKPDPHADYDWHGDIQDRMNLLAGSPHAESVASEIPEGSSFLGSGMEGITFRAPDGSVIRIGDHPNQSNRADIPEMLQAFRETRVGPYKVEHMPMVSPVAESFDSPLKMAGRKINEMSDPSRASDASLDAMHAVQANNDMNYAHENLASEIRQGIRQRGLDPWDASTWNTGITPEGKGIIFDGGAVQGLDEGSFDYPQLAPKPTYDAPSGDLLRRVMEAGGPEKVRESLRQGIAAGTQGQGVDSPWLPELIAKRQAVQDFLSAHGVDQGMHVAGRPAMSSAPQYAGAASGSAPSLGKLLGTGAATIGGGSLLAYLLGGGQAHGNPR